MALSFLSKKSSLNAHGPGYYSASISSTIPERGFLNDTEKEKTLAVLEKGHKVIKVRFGKQWTPYSRLLCLQKQSCQVLLFKTDSPGKCSTRPKILDVTLIKHVASLDQRYHSKIVERWRRDRDLLVFDISRVLLISYGNQFVLDLQIYLFESSEACRMWAVGLKHLVHECLRSPYPVQVDRWLRKEFYQMETLPGTGWIAVKDLKAFLKRVHHQIDSKLFREVVQKSMKMSAGKSDSTNTVSECIFGLKERLSYEQFRAVYKNLIYVHSLFTLFPLYSEDSFVNFEKFLSFLHNEQQDDMALDNSACTEYLKNYFSTVERFPMSDELAFSKEEFLDYLFSKENSVWCAKNDRVCQDMDQPLCCYWIASSHNTYLTGDQLKSESTLEAYTRALLMGCRSVELDCWDGAEGPPYEIIIYHGYTLTSKLHFPDVLKAIKEYAFVTSDYPVILSIEDNCSLPFQRQMAVYFKEILGELLVTSAVDPDGHMLPSPNQLKRKIILKHKKLPRDTDRTVSVSSSVSLDDSLPNQENDLLSHPDTQKRGLLYIKDSLTENWSPHIFVLTGDRLYYSEDTSKLLGTDPSPNDCASSVPKDDEGLRVNMEDLHLSEVWFHGKISRDLAEKLLRENGMKLGDGVFLVRASTTFSGDYSLSFWFRGGVHHCRIKTAHIQSERKYYLLEKNKMDSLYELISYYQERPLNTPKFTTLLRIPCPQFSVHEGKPWFGGDIGRAKAEELLNQYPQDGAFLIRKSQSDASAFTLSFRVDCVIKHCRLKQEGRLFVIGNLQFEDLVSLVDYYSKRPLYHGVGLKFPVNKETIENYAVTMSNTPTGSYMDLQNSNTTVKVRAKYDYEAKDSNEEISFPANAIISNVVRESEDWWVGEYHGKRGYFPRNYVEELSAEAAQLCQLAIVSMTESHTLGWIDLAGLEIEPVPATDGAREYCFSIKNLTAAPDEKFICISAQSEDDMTDWINSLIALAKSANDKVAKIRRKENVMRIASELSDLVVYCQAVPFDPNKIPGNFYEMCSYSDAKHEKLVEKGMARFSQFQLSRIYPNASRLSSSNFFPMPMWNAGCQMVALNYQTGDKPMQLNQGRFLANGRCGYVLKPSYMNLEFFNPLDKSSIMGNKPITLTLQIIAGRHLFRRDKSKGTVSPYVEVEILGYSCDNATYRTEAASVNGLNPVWNTTFEFNVFCAEMALIRFCVQDEDFLSNDPFIGQAVFPLDLRNGYRSVPLKNAYSEDLELAALLINVNVTSQDRSNTTRPSRTPLMRQVREVDCHPSLNNLEEALPQQTENGLVQRFYSCPTRSTAITTMSRAASQALEEHGEKPKRGIKQLFKMKSKC